METFTPETIRHDDVKNSSAAFSMVKVFIWLAVGLLVSGAVSFAIPMVFNSIIANGTVDELSAFMNGFMIATILSAVLSIVFAMVLNLSAVRSKAGLIIAFYLLYALCIGVLLSSSFITLLCSSDGEIDRDGLSTICLSFVVTGACFLVMGLIGSFVKKNLNVLVPVLLTLLIGCLVISLVNFFIGSDLIYWLVEYAILAVVLLIVAIDMNRVKKLAEGGGFLNNNILAVYCAYCLYTDFINIFIRILQIFAASKRK